MALRSFTFTALAICIFLINFDACNTEESFTSVVKTSSVKHSNTATSSSRTKVKSPKKKKCKKVMRCPKNEEFSFCTQSISRAQYCSQKGQSLYLQENTKCTEGCVCKENYLRSNNGTCIPQRTCNADCGQDEILDECPTDCADDYCPTKDGETRACFRPDQDQCPPPVCKCKFNSRRAENGTCISTRDCPPFDCSAKPNEQYAPCPPICPTDSCGLPRVSGRCPFRIGIVLKCNPKCQCKDGYGRLKDGTCVPFDKCTNICPVNEEYSTCTQAVCRQQNCTARNDPVSCPRLDPAFCKRNCVCKENYYRNKNGTCVPQDQCDANICPVNEEYSACTQAVCRQQNCTARNDPVSCPRLDPEFCERNCVCKENYYRNKNGTCVPQDQCDDIPKQTCDDNEVIVDCPSECRSDYCPKCEEDNKSCPQPNPCPPPACKCAFNYRRAQNGTCIRTVDCPPFDCSAKPNEQYAPCPPICPSDSCSMSRVRGRCPFKIGIVLKCNPKCQCKDGYGRLEDGTCVPFDKCPDLCPTNEEYNSCTQAICRPLNCTNKSDTLPCPMVRESSCKKDCVCKENYYRNVKGVCVTGEECAVPVCPNPHEEYKKSFVPNCPALGTCTSILARIACDKPEIASCTCESGYLRLNESSPCIPTCECPQMKYSSQCQKDGS